MGHGHRAEELRAKDGAVFSGDAADTGVGPSAALDRIVVFAGVFPHDDEALGISGCGTLASHCRDIFTGVRHVEAADGHHAAAIGSDMADIGAVKVECAAIVAEILAVFSRQCVESRMALEFGDSERAAVVVHLGVDTGGDRVACPGGNDGFAGIYFVGA